MQLWHALRSNFVAVRSQRRVRLKRDLTPFILMDIAETFCSPMLTAAAVQPVILAWTHHMCHRRLAFPSYAGQGAWQLQVKD